MYNFSLFEIRLDKKSSNNNEWAKSINRAIDIQVEGFEHFDSGKKSKYKVVFKDYSLLDLKASDFIVPSNYYFINDIYVDIKRQIAIRQKSDKELEYWCKSSYGLSLPFIFQLILVKNNQSFIHSGAFSYGEKGVVMSAFGGIGKTAVLARVAYKEGFKVMGDDLNILNENGSILSYPRPFCLYRYHKPLFKNFYTKNRLTYLRPVLFWRVYGRFLKEIHQRTGINLEISKYITNWTGYITASPFNIFNMKDIELRSLPLDYAFIIGRHNKGSKVLITKASKEEFADFSLNVLYHEWDYMDKSLKGYLTFNKVGLSTYFENVKKIMKKSVSNVDYIYKIELPISMKMEKSTEELFFQIQKIINE
jgi:hypothetical protein